MKLDDAKGVSAIAEAGGCQIAESERKSKRSGEVKMKERASTVAG